MTIATTREDNTLQNESRRSWNLRSNADFDAITATRGMPPVPRPGSGDARRNRARPARIAGPVPQGLRRPDAE
jgi:hypothetical protein